ncbi:CLUMA_CG018426, isoform A [Clunio marinus]|uniref:CLUMA_CG018426, isoform A n=1 Tax=Clunio marinus TaxID=568069 RepID=A0A1J1J100_9DIPT|nr:CLUMA_CG018426, isoform A [Clunio marinus]
MSTRNKNPILVRILPPHNLKLIKCLRVRDNKKIHLDYERNSIPQTFIASTACRGFFYYLTGRISKAEKNL